MATVAVVARRELLEREAVLEALSAALAEVDAGHGRLAVRGRRERRGQDRRRARVRRLRAAARAVGCLRPALHPGAAGAVRRRRVERRRRAAIRARPAVHGARGVRRAPGRRRRRDVRAGDRGRALGGRGDARRAPDPRPPHHRHAAARHRHAPGRPRRTGRFAPGRAGRPGGRRRRLPRRGRAAQQGGGRHPRQGPRGRSRRAAPPHGRQPVLRAGGARGRRRRRAADGARCRHRPALPARRRHPWRARRDRVLAAADGDVAARRALPARAARSPRRSRPACWPRRTPRSPTGTRSRARPSPTRCRPPGAPSCTAHPARPRRNEQPTDPARLAHHAELAGQAHAAVRFATAAAARAAAVGAHRQAAAQYGRALRFAEGATPTGRAGDLLEQRADRPLRGGRPARVDPRPARRDRAAPRTGDIGREADATALLVPRLLCRGYVDEAQEAAERALELVAGPDLPQTGGRARRARAPVPRGRPPRGHHRGRRARDRGSRSLRRPTRPDATPRSRSGSRTRCAATRAGRNVWNRHSSARRRHSSTPSSPARSTASPTRRSPRRDAAAANRWIAEGLAYVDGHELDLWRLSILSHPPPGASSTRAGGARRPRPAASCWRTSATRPSRRGGARGARAGPRPAR